MPKLTACCCLLLLGSASAQTQVTTEVSTFVAPAATVAFSDAVSGTFQLPEVGPWQVALPRYSGPRILVGVRLKLDVKMFDALQATMTQPNTVLYTEQAFDLQVRSPSGLEVGVAYSRYRSYSFAASTSLVAPASPFGYSSSSGFQQLAQADLHPFTGTGNILLTFDGSIEASGSVPVGALQAAYGYQGSQLRVTAEYTTEAPWVIYGAGCAGSGGLVPQIGMQGSARITGVPFDITLQDAAPNSVAMLALSATRSQIPLTGGCSFLLDLGFVTVDVFLTQGDGSWATTLALPNVPGMVGQYLHAQQFVFDAQGAHEGWLTLSPGLGVLIGG